MMTESFAYLKASFLYLQVSLQVEHLSSIFCWHNWFNALCPNLNQIARFWKDKPHVNKLNFISS